MCCHYCGTGITDLDNILLQHKTLKEKYRVVNPSCTDCSKFITQRPVPVKQSLKMRKTKRAQTKAVMNKRVLKKMRVLPPLSQAEIPELTTSDPATAAFERWRKANKEWWKKLR